MYDARMQGPVKRWVHDTFSLGVRITQEAIEDDLYGVMKTAFRDLGVSARATRHLLAIRLPYQAVIGIAHAWISIMSRHPLGTLKAEPEAGNLRVDYVLPCRELRVDDAGVFWPAGSEDADALVTVSDHRLVWIDVRL